MGVRIPPVTLKTVADYAKNSFDFSFEMQVLNLLMAAKYKCEHGWTYADPDTGQNRQFDIRAFKDHGISAGRTGRLHLAVECKNVGAGNAVIVHMVQRKPSEAYHHLITDSGHLMVGGTVGQHEFFKSSGPLRGAGSILKRPTNFSIYSSDRGSFVGKAINQFNPNKASSKANRDLYDSWLQPISSARALVNKLIMEYEETKKVSHFILPVLVIPEDRLFAIFYNDDGSQLETKKISNASLLVNIEHLLPATNKTGTPRYCFTHLEIVEISTLIGKLKSLTGDGMTAGEPLFC